MEISSILYGIAIILLIPVLKKIIKWRQFVNTVNKIPGPKSYPLIGTMWEFQGLKRENLFDVQIERMKKYRKDGLYRDWIVGKPEIRLLKAEFIEKVLTSNTNIKKSEFYELEIKKWLGNGLIISSGEKWHTHRKILTPTFHFSILEGFCDVFAEKCQIMIEKLMPFAGTGKTIDIFGYLNHCALDIICETAMGIQMNAQETGESDYIKAVAEISTVGARRFLNPLYHYNWIFSLTSYGARSRKALHTLHSFTDKVIQERKEMRKKISLNKNDSTEGWEDIGKKRRKAFLDLVLDETEKRPFFTDKDIREEVDTFMFAGHDTTTVSAAFALYLIGLHPDVQEKLYEEQMSIFDDSRELPTHKTLSEMKYMDRVMKECIRVYPTVLSVSRNVIEEFEVGGYKIPKGANVSIGIYHVTRDERYFPDPERFELQKKRFETYKGIYRDWVVGTPEIRLQRPEYVEKVITSTTNISKGQFYNLEFKKWLDNGLITSTGETWHTHRKILTPAFHFSILEGFCEIFSEKCQIMIKKIEDNTVWRDEEQYSDVIDVYQYVNHCALDIICGIFMNFDKKP
uniref:CSON004226 protein n=1 Tax=Culicoides sonorensis TaxID=179676 RepID=A0A336LX39_CULSO